MKILSKEEVVMDPESIEIIAKRVRAALAAKQQPQEETVSVDEAAAVIGAAINARVDRKIQESRTTPTETREELMEGAAKEIIENPQAGFAELFRGLAERKRKRKP